MELHIRQAAQSMQLCRHDLFTDVVHNRAYGDISQVWQFQGHILITTDEGRKLFTFDCKPIHQQHVFDSKCLDISILLTPLIDVLMLSSCVIALIDTAGNMMLWKFTPEFSWTHEGNIQVCTSADAQIISVTYLSECNTLFWCERQPAELPSSVSSSSSFTYCICKRQLCSDLDPQKIQEQSQSSLFIQNCPPTDVYTMSSNFLFMTTQFDSDQVTLHLAFDVANSQLSLFVSEEYVSYPMFHEAVDFHEVIMMNLSVLMQSEPGSGDLGVRSDITKQQIAVLSSNGHLELFTCLSGKKGISKKMITLSSESCKAYKVHSKNWFLHREHIGIITDGIVNIFSLEDGKCVCRSVQDSVRNVEKVIKSTSLIFLAWLLTSNNLFALQGVETESKEMYTAADKLPDDHLLQTDTLRLAHLHELRMHGCNQTLVKELEHLRKKWTDIRNLSHHSHISNITAPYLEEYWRLENLSQALINSEKQPVIKASVNSADHMVKTLMESRSLSKAARHAKLLWLSEVHPQELLDYLCQGINTDSDIIPPSEIKKWQSLLGMEGGNLMNFEFICRLLFRLMPAKLLNFVKCAESVSEQTVGASAFVRKKHSLIYYKSAWECLPHSQASLDPQTAASVKAKLILASDSENCVERALKYLLQNGLWSDAVELVKGQVGNEDGLPVYLHITMRALAESQVLSDYIADLLTVMPSWKSLVSFSQLATERPEIRQQQLSNLATNVFFQGSPDVRLGDVRPVLLNLISR